MSKDAQSWRPIEELYIWPLGAALVLSVLIALGLAGPGVLGIGAAPTTGRGTARGTEQRHA
jgi:hypothetical protein